MHKRFVPSLYRLRSHLRCAEWMDSAAGDHGSRIGDLDCSEPNNTHQSQSSITERGVIGAGWQRALCNLADLIIDSAGSWATIHRKYGGPNPSALRSQAVTVQPRGRVGGLLHGPGMVGRKHHIKHFRADQVDRSQSRTRVDVTLPGSVGSLPSKKTSRVACTSAVPHLIIQ